MKKKLHYTIVGIIRLLPIIPIIMILLMSIREGFGSMNMLEVFEEFTSSMTNYFDEFFNGSAQWCDDLITWFNNNVFSNVYTAPVVYIGVYQIVVSMLDLLYDCLAFIIECGHRLIEKGVNVND